MSASVVIGIDVGGTKVAGGLLSSSNQLLVRRQRPTVVDGGRDPGLAVTRLLAEELIADAAAAGVVVEGVGVGFPEYVDPGGSLTSHEVLAWTIQPAELLADLGPITVDSDVRCAALGEGELGAAAGFDSYAFVIVGTGLSYALVEDGRARPGARGEAIALGELEVSRSVDAATTLTLERYASGEGIRERYMAATDRSAGGAVEVIAEAERGNPIALAIVDSAARAVGAGLATLVRLIDPAAVVVGGGVSTSGDRWRSAVAATYADAAGVRSAAPPLRWAALGSDAGIIGAAISHRNRIAAGARSTTA